MKVFASLLLLALAAVVAVQANVQPTPAPRIEKRQSFDPYNLSQYTDQGAISSLSAYINSQFGALESMSLGPDMSSYLASQRSQAYSYLSLASSIIANGGASNTNLGSILGSLTATQNAGAGSAPGSGSGSGSGGSAASAASAASAISSRAPNAAVGASAQMSSVMAGIVVCTFITALAGAFAL
ncbi:hypothetical protein NDA13_002832 [Ustilago tritici]|nr:hypothetical protein NDA13_002832 [Ustilago tritici]